ncbi:MAG: hypothetical protein WBB07_15410 [Mycobacterium sp.]
MPVTQQGEIRCSIGMCSRTSTDQTARLRESLGEDLLAAIREQFPDSAQFGMHCESVGVGRGKVWNRIGG